MPARGRARRERHAAHCLRTDPGYITNAANARTIALNDARAQSSAFGLHWANHTGVTAMDKIKPLFTATATATGGRNGHTQSSDGRVSVDLSVPKAMGGPGKPGTTTPEDLFAAGYAACFGGALDFVAKQQKKDATKASVTCAVSIGPRDGGGFGLSVRMRIEDRSLAQSDLENLAREAHEKICPYSHATRNNVSVEFEIVGG
jgi:lipoyl-dependent peroxiredoxin